MPNYDIQTKLPRPEQTKSKEPKFKSYGQQVFSLKTLLLVLAVRPLSKPEIEEKTGLTNTTVTRWVNILHAGYPNNILHVVTWRRRGERGQWQAIYGIGIGLPDDPKPKPLGEAAYSRRYRNKLAKKDRIIQVKDGVIQHVTERRSSERRKEEREGKERRSDLSRKL